MCLYETLHYFSDRKQNKEVNIPSTITDQSLSRLIVLCQMFYGILQIMCINL